jgi:hypothetical protein
MKSERNQLAMLEDWLATQSLFRLPVTSFSSQIILQGAQSNAALLTKLSLLLPALPVSRH